MSSIIEFFNRFRRRYNTDTEEAIREVQAHIRGEIELEEGYVPPRIVLKNEVPEGSIWKIYQTSQFKSDLERLIRRGMDLSELDNVINILASGGILPKKYRDHPLKGDRKGTRECHIRPDWILVYSINKQEFILWEIRTGTHSDIF